MILGIDMNMIYIVVVSINIVSLSDILMLPAFSALNLHSARIVQMCRRVPYARGQFGSKVAMQAESKSVRFIAYSHRVHANLQ